MPLLLQMDSGSYGFLDRNDNRRAINLCKSLTLASIFGCTCSRYFDPCNLVITGSNIKWILRALATPRQLLQTLEVHDDFRVNTASCYSLHISSEARASYNCCLVVLGDQSTVAEGFTTHPTHNAVENPDSLEAKYSHPRWYER